MIAILLGIAAVILLREVLAIAFLGLLLGLLLGFPVDLLARRMPRGPALLVVLALASGGFGAIGYVTSQRVAEQVEQLREGLPDALQRARQWWQDAAGDASAAQNDAASQPSSQTNEIGKTADVPSVYGQAQQLIGPVWSHAGQAASGLVALATALIVVIVLGAFFAHAPSLYRDGVRALTPRSSEAEVDELWNRTSTGLRHWLGGILVSMTIMGVFAAVGLALVGIQDWLLLGLLTFFGTFVPYVGVIASALPGLVLALGQSTDKFLAALAVYLAVHIVEGYLVQPLIMKRAVIIRPAVLLIWQFAMTILMGPLGIVIATPLLVCVKIGVGYLYIERRLSKHAAAV